MTFTRDGDGWWVKPDDTGTPVYFKREGTSLIGKVSSGRAEAIDLSTYFELTGSEDWTRATVVYTRPKEKNGEVRTQVEKDRLIAEITIDGATHEAVVTWHTTK